VDKYQKTKDAYKKEKVQRIDIYVPMGQKDKIKAYAKTNARSLNAYMLDLIQKDMEQNQD
jgi:hypothetical protein